MPHPEKLSIPHVAISSLTFSDGKQVQISQKDIVLIVGPNNAGKSAALRAIKEKLLDSSFRSPVIQNLQIQRIGTIQDFEDWLFRWTVKQNDSSLDNPIYQGLGQAIYRSEAISLWNRTDNILGGLTHWFCHLLSADERLKICNPVNNIDFTNDNPDHPIHFLMRDDQLETKLSARYRKAFGVEIIVHRNAGNKIPLYVGTRPVPVKALSEDRVSLSYVKKVESLPLLHTQGDGMRSFAGVLLATSVGRESILLIDKANLKRMISNIELKNHKHFSLIFLAIYVFAHHTQQF